MITLLGLMRKQMNGAVADAMHYYGERYGLNYGVSLPTLRQIAAKEERSHSLAQYLYKQQVRELRLAALHIAEEQMMTLSEAESWEYGIINSEVAEEMAFALLHKAKESREIIAKWSASQNEWLVYSALMAAARNAENISEELVANTASIIGRFPSSRVIAQGVVALLTRAAQQSDLHPASLTAAEEIKTLPTSSEGDFSAAEYATEELEWRLAE